MPVLRGPAPRSLYDILLAHGFEVIDETADNWLVVDAGDSGAIPILLPKHGDEVDPDVMGRLMGKPGLGQAVLDALRNSPRP